MAKSVVIIGAGIGGLTAAVGLAYAGYEVTVLEKNPQVGGKVYVYQSGGFRWDTGPATFAPKYALGALFDDLGLDLSSYMRLLPIDPSTRFHFPHGSVFDSRRDWADAASEIAQLDPNDVEGYLRFLAYAARLHRIAYVQRASGALPQSDSGEESIWHWLRSDPFRSMHRAISRFVKSEELQQVLGNFSSSRGGSPYAIPATLNALIHQSLSEGIWYPQNGIYSVATALERLAREQGVAIHLNCPVQSINIKGDAARGVLLQDGQILPGDAILSNVDIISTLRFLLPDGALPAATQRQLLRTPLSSSAFVIVLGVRGTHPQLAHHNVFFSEDRRREFHQIFQREVMPDDPTISITISSKTDSLHAPVNHENWLIRVNAPPLSEKFDWAAERERYRERILTILYQRYGLDLRECIRTETHLTPADFQRMTGACRGSLFGRLPHARSLLLTPPTIRSNFIAGLYFAGNTTQAGGDNAMGIQSGRLAAATISQDLK